MSKSFSGPSSRKRVSRRLSREMALQGIYHWLVFPADSKVIQDCVVQLASDFDAEIPEERIVDQEHFEVLLHGILCSVSQLDQLIAPHLDRTLVELSPVEHGVLLLGAFELRNLPDIPYRVVINEAVELAKIFGGTDGYKYVNGVLDRIASCSRPHEINQSFLKKSNN